MKKPRWSRKLAYPIETRDGRTLVTLQDAADFVLEQPEHVPWPHMAGALMEAATGASAIEAVTLSLERALFMTFKLKIERDTPRKSLKR